MDLRFLFTQQLYLLKQKIDVLSERDRVLLLFLIAVGLSVFWYFAVFTSQMKVKENINAKIMKIKERTELFTEKKKVIQILVSHPDTAKVMSRYKELTAVIARLDKGFIQYNERYIAGRDLAQLLHDMLKQTLGVTIENFGTVVAPAVPLAPQTTPTPQKSSIPASSASQMRLQITHYRLVLRGTYFPVMRYLQLLEKLPWRLYWDKFDYTVAKYPEGVATVDFYTLKPHSSEIKHGGNP